jgi:Fe-S cluster biogenesis protein NfuA
MDLGFRMHAERTPNPNSVKWVLGQGVTRVTGATEEGEGVATANFAEPPAVAVSPLACRLFEVDGVTSVFLGPDFVTVSKRPELEWADLAPPIVAAIKAWAGLAEPALGAEYRAPEQDDPGGVVSRIREILQRDIAPYVAQDGGEISFAGFRDGVVEVYLQGACAGCPSSTVTLKMGIEARLKEEIPEVDSVVAL